MVSAAISTARNLWVDGALETYRSPPAVTVFGEHNDYLGSQEKWAERLDDLQQIEIPKGNHFPMCDAPTLVGETIRARFGPAPEHIA